LCCVCTCSGVVHRITSQSSAGGAGGQMPGNSRPYKQAQLDAEDSDESPDTDDSSEEGLE